MRCVELTIDQQSSPLIQRLAAPPPHIPPQRRVCRRAEGGSSDRPLPGEIGRGEGDAHVDLHELVKGQINSMFYEIKGKDGFVASIRTARRCPSR
jgi:hypothetical protein